MSNTANPFGNPVADDNGGASFSWDSIEEGDSKFVIPEGTYKVRVVDVTHGRSKNGNDMLTWTFAVTEGEHVGFELKDWTVLTPGKSFKAYKYRNVLGITGSGVEAARNKEAQARVTTRSYTQDGEERKSSSIKDLMPL
jgi:hypothetical protein